MYVQVHIVICNEILLDILCDNFGTEWLSEVLSGYFLTA